MKPPLDLSGLRVQPLANRRTLTRVEDVLVDPDSVPATVGDVNERFLGEINKRIRAARDRGSSVLLIYGAHLLRNGAAGIVGELIGNGWVTHLATNGAGTIHDWEFAWLGWSAECVRENVAAGTFGAWDETGRFINLAVLAGGLRDEGYGQALGRFIAEDGTTLPDANELVQLIRDEPDHPLTPARAELLQAMRRHELTGGRMEIAHRWKHASIVARAFQQNVPLSVHPGIGYDIITNHPMFNGAAIGRAAAVDFRRFCRAVEELDHGVVLSIGSAVMGPQVFEKSLSCVNNLRLQAGRNPVAGHSIYVVDLQDGGNWDWSQGEPPKSNPAYYLRFCKSYSRMGGAMQYLQCDNVAFTHRLLHLLREP